MIFHARDFEDVMLLRALGARPTGFSIDAGAWRPALHSVTKAFHDLGWSGISVEPNPKFRAQFAPFSVPPNIFDRFEPAEVHTLRQEARRLKSLLSRQRPGTIPG